MLPALRKKDSLFDFFGKDLFSDFFDDFGTNYNKNTEGQTVLEIEVPGFNKDTISVEVSNSILTVQGESGTRKIYKRYQLGNVQDVQASIKDGILTLILIEPEEDKKQITIQ